MSLRKQSREHGFTLLEVTVASMILGTAVLAVGMLIMKMTNGSVLSKDTSSSAVLLSEKLEDLNRWDGDDPQICIPTGSTSIGSLTSDVTQTTTCSGGASAGVDYFDSVYPNLVNGTSSCPGSADGCFAETVTSVSGGATTYTTTVHSPNGIVQTTSGTTPPNAGGTSFHRRWVIEGNTPTTGVRRVTVLVTLNNLAIQPPVTLQMSIVRP